MKGEKPPKMIRIVPGLALPEYMSFLLKHCKPTGYTKKAIDAGHLILIDYHPPYVQLICREMDKVIKESKERGLRIYRAKKHITITDGIYRVRIYLQKE